MKLTAEQEAIIASTGDITINAVAGSGKTTTVIEYARTRPRGSRILYLAFNKSVKLEAIKKFREKGLSNISIETAHSLAYGYIVRDSNFRVNPTGYKSYEVAQKLGISNTGERLSEYIIANHINKFVSLFCNSDKHKVEEINYWETLSDKKAIQFAKTFNSAITQGTRQFLAMMNRGEMEITHDFYLKKFQLQKPVLPFDYILFDEGQDASPAMLDIFLNQPCTKVIVGDTHQQIYGWRYAVNSMEKTNFQKYFLSHSFRFGQNIANLATQILDWKDYISKYQPIEIKGEAAIKNVDSKAVLGRTNLGLLLKAIEYVEEKKNLKKIYFEGNINSYTYADEGASLYDVLNLYNYKREMIRDSLIKSMHSMKDLEEYIEKTEDVQLGLMVEIVKKYGNDIYDILKSIKEKHVEGDRKEDAEVIFSTVHRCKGMEYGHVHLVNDFITEDKVEKIKHELEQDDKKIANTIEEINLLYVAVTRTINKLHIPEELLPENFPACPEIVRIKKEEKKEEPIYEFPSKKNKYTKFHPGSRTFSVELHRTKASDAAKPWNHEDDETLVDMFQSGKTMSEMIKTFGRTAGAIKGRLKKLGEGK